MRSYFKLEGKPHVLYTSIAHDLDNMFLRKLVKDIKEGAVKREPITIYGVRYVASHEFPDEIEYYSRLEFEYKNRSTKDWAYMPFILVSNSDLCPKPEHGLEGFLINEDEAILLPDTMRYLRM